MFQRVVNQALAITLLALVFLSLQITANSTTLSVKELFSKLSAVNKNIDSMLALIDKKKEATIVLGRTGSGKTTLINYLLKRPLVLLKEKNINSYMI